MKANELADEIEKGYDGFRRDLIVTLLRDQQAEIEKLGSELDRIVELYTDKAIENEALKELLANEGIVVGHDYLNNCIAILRKASEK